MSAVAVAGGLGDMGSRITGALVERGKYEVYIMSREVRPMLEISLERDLFMSISNGKRIATQNRRTFKVASSDYCHRDRLFIRG